MPAHRHIDLIASSFHDGLPGAGRGSGPDVLLADPAIAGVGSVHGIDPVDPAESEIVRIAELNRRLARRVHQTVEGGGFPLVLAGDCNSCLGTTAGLGGGRELGTVWFDAHADFDDPDDSLGYFDAMGLAILTGHGWRRLRESIPGFEVVPEQSVLLAGVRDLEPWQREAVDRSDLGTLPGAGWSGAERDAALAGLGQRVRRVYLHVDLDALDPSEGVANAFSAPGGLTLGQLTGAIAAVFDRFEVAGAAVTAYEPAADRDGAMAVTARSVVAAIAAGASPP